MSKENAIIVFAKYPQEGLVKSRLAETTGDFFAAVFYQITAEHIFHEVDSILNESTDCFLYYSDPEENHSAYMQA